MNDPNTPTTSKPGIMSHLPLGALFMILLVWIPLHGQTKAYQETSQTLTPTPDRLAEPDLSENPTQYEAGRHLYWLNCMPCHGDQGQGLTDEFRELWPEDHQNCWGRGCHGGRIEDEGFPIPREIPAVISSSSDNLIFSNPEELFEYLHSTHPPQNPGILPDDEYWAIADYVLAENNYLLPDQEIGPQAEMAAQNKILWAETTIPVLLIVSAIIIWILRKRKAPKLPPLEP